LGLVTGARVPSSAGDTGAVQAYVGLVPVLLAARVTVPPEPTVYGPPALATGAMHTGGGVGIPGHGLSCPATTPVKEV
jgi:hypothetical protein